MLIREKGQVGNNKNKIYNSWALAPQGHSGQRAMQCIYIHTHIYIYTHGSGDTEFYKVHVFLGRGEGEREGDGGERERRREREGGWNGRDDFFSQMQQEAYSCSQSDG